MFRERLEELHLLAKDEDLSRATRRLLDFLTDFSFPESLLQKAVDIRAAYSTDPTQAEELLPRLQTLIGEIDQWLYSGPETEYGDWRTSFFREQNRKQNHIPAASIVFSGKGISKTFETPNFRFRLPVMDLILKQGEITGVVGENGNGKTTLLRVVAAELEADSGEVLYPALGKPDDWYHIRQRIAFIPQQLRPWRGLLKENLHFAASIHGITGKENEALVDFIIHRMGLSQYEEALWSEISSGYRLRFEMARALIRKPALLIIDEPLANLDIHTQTVFLQDLRYLADSAEKPLSILLSSQHLHEVESIADNIIFIQKGEALYNGKVKEFGQDRTENLYELSASASQAELQSVLGELEGLKINASGTGWILRTPVSVDATTLLQLLSKHKVPVSYFRDISTSTLKLFREQA